MESSLRENHTVSCPAWRYSSWIAENIRTLDSTDRRAGQGSARTSPLSHEYGWWCLLKSKHACWDDAGRVTTTE